MNLENNVCACMHACVCVCVCVCVFSLLEELSHQPLSLLKLIDLYVAACFIDLFVAVC